MQHVLAGAWVALILIAVTQIVHALHLFDRADAIFLKEVMRVRALHDFGAPPAPPATPRPPVHLLEVVPEAKLRDLEQHGEVARTTLLRLGAVRPIDRGALADLLRRLAHRLPAPADGRPLPVVAIDVDLAPLELGGDRRERVGDGDAMRQALAELRRKADVVAIALDRADDAERARRNRFIVEAGCSRAVPTPADPPRRPAGSAAAPGGLYFASPRLFMRSGDYPIEFLHRIAGAASGQPVASGQAALFPSLGTLLHALTHAPQQPPDPAEREALTLLCEQAHAAQAGDRQPDPVPVRFLEDRLAAASGASELDHWLNGYRREYLNWALLDPGLIRTTMVYTPWSIADCREVACARPPAAADRTLAQETRLGDDWFVAPATAAAPLLLLLAIDGGPGFDKFGAASPTGEPVSGATLHALQALSLGTPLRTGLPIDLPAPLPTRLPAGLLADALFAAAFIAVWEAVRWLRQWAGAAAFPRLDRAATAVAALLLAGGLAWASLRAAAWAVGWGFWFNPLYLLLGLTLHAYAEAWQPEHRALVVESPHDRWLARALGAIVIAGGIVALAFGEH